MSKALMAFAVSMRTILEFPSLVEIEILIVSTKKGGTGVKFLGLKTVVCPTTKDLTSSSVSTASRWSIFGIASGF